MNDNQVTEETPVLLNETEKNAVSIIVARIVELIKETHL
jgi:hypothetical protein